MVFSMWEGFSQALCVECKGQIAWDFPGSLKILPSWEVGLTPVIHRYLRFYISTFVLVLNARKEVSSIGTYT